MLQSVQDTRIIQDLTHMFWGSYKTCIQCDDVDFESEQQQSFIGLDLEVAGCKDLYASLDKFCEVEVLHRANQYNAEGHGRVVSVQMCATSVNLANCKCECCC